MSYIKKSIINKDYYLLDKFHLPSDFKNNKIIEKFTFDASKYKTTNVAKNALIVNYSISKFPQAIQAWKGTVGNINSGNYAFDENNNTYMQISSKTIDVNPLWTGVIFQPTLIYNIVFTPLLATGIYMQYSGNPKCNSVDATAQLLTDAGIADPTCAWNSSSVNSTSATIPCYQNTMRQTIAANLDDKDFPGITVLCYTDVQIKDFITAASGTTSFNALTNLPSVATYTITSLKTGNNSATLYTFSGTTFTPSKTSDVTLSYDTNNILTVSVMPTNVLNISAVVILLGGNNNLNTSGSLAIRTFSVNNIFPNYIGCYNTNNTLSNKDLTNTTNTVTTCAQSAFNNNSTYFGITKSGSETPQCVFGNLNTNLNQLTINNDNLSCIPNTLDNSNLIGSKSELMAIYQFPFSDVAAAAYQSLQLTSILLPAQIAAYPVASFTSAQLSALSPIQMVALTPTQIKALTKTQLSGFTSAQIGLMTTEQLTALN